VPGDIRYPTDLSLLNEGREKLEEIIDTLHADRPKARRNRERIGRERERIF
jgi:IS5 family transposase